MPLEIVIGVVVIVVVIVVVLGVRAVRSRSERSDWIGELSEIRRSSLGDDEEVTGALEAVTIVDRADEETAGGAVAVTDAPTRTVEDAGTVFHEYVWPGLGRLRVDATDERGLRVLVDDVDVPSRLAADLPRGMLWFRSLGTGVSGSCSVRTPAGWVMARGDLLIVASDVDWTYVMCLDGEATIRFGGDGPRSTMVTGQIGRIRVGSNDHDIVDVGADALESEGAVRRQRRLDQRSAQDDGHE